jgi:cytochrome c553
MNTEPSKNIADCRLTIGRLAIGLLIGLSLACLSAAASAAQPTPADLEFFEKQVRPLLAAKCYQCHSARAKKLKAKLRLDSRAGVLKGGESGAAIVLGKPESSRLIDAIRYGELEMPPKGKLRADQIAVLERWVRSGAPWPEEEAPQAIATDEVIDWQARRDSHWAWKPVRRPPTPKASDPSWPRGWIDSMILAKLDQAKLKPAPAAGRRLLIRRLYFDLIGLPPTPEEVAAFMGDASKQALEKVVDRLLASPHFGERWARHWMDLVRYAESRGHESDFIIANAYHYRDYLIRAFNADVPYDQFVLEHLAGDLLNPPRLHPKLGWNESVLGTGWAFLGEEVHSPVDIRQDECDRTDNKIDVLSKTFLGLTVACARCHDHKFDAIRQRDYYGLAGFIISSNYRQVRFQSMEHNRAIARQIETLRQATQKKLSGETVAAQKAVSERLDDYLLAAREVILSRATAKQKAAASKLDASVIGHWAQALRAAAKNPRDPLHAFALVAHDGAADQPERFKWVLKPVIGSLVQQESSAAAAKANERVILDYSQPGPHPWMADGFAFGMGPMRLGDVRFGMSEKKSLLGVADYGAAVKDPTWDVLKLAPGNQNDSGSLAATARSGRMLRTPKFTLKTGKLFYLVKGSGQVYAGVDSHLMIIGPLHGRLMSKVKSPSPDKAAWVAHDLSAYRGHRVHIEFGARPGAALEILKVVEADKAPQPVPHSATVLLSSLQDNNVRSPAALAKGYRTLLRDTMRRWASGQIAQRKSARSDAHLVSWMMHRPQLFVAAGDSLKKKQESIASEFNVGRRALAEKIKKSSLTAVSMMDGNGVDEFVLVRGKSGQPSITAPRGLPWAMLGENVIQTPGSGRLELARQIVDSKNPLTARVFVNRVWHHLMGRGIVSTVDNFGHLGQRPTHPALLDGLADRFVHDYGWSLKRLAREIVLSKTYGVTSRPVDPDAERLDPKNLLWHRHPVKRLQGEVIRDAVLAVSGRLDRTQFGPPVPVHLTEFVVGRGRPKRSGPLDGAGRRSVYVAVRRNFLPTMMLAFDVPIPFSTVGRRNVTNVPAQSLVMMNDKFIYQQAEVWAGRIVRDMPDRSPRERIERMYREAMGRPPSKNELAACLQSLAEIAALHKVTSRDVKAWTHLSHALFSTTDFIYLR